MAISTPNLVLPSGELLELLSLQVTFEMNGEMQSDK